MNYIWTPESFGASVGILLTLIFTLAPKLNIWYAGQDDDTKRQIMALVLLGVAVLGGIASCTGLLVVLTCSKDGFISFTLQILIPAIVTNQSFNLIIPKPASVKAAKLAGQVRRGEIIR